MGAKALLGGSGQPEAHGPLGELGVAALHDRAGHDREVLAAGLLPATVHARLLGLVGLQRAALGAVGASRPAGGLKPSAGGIFIVKVLGGENILTNWGGLSNYPRNLAFVLCGVNYVIGIIILIR